MVLAVIAVFGFLYFQGGGTTPGGENAGTNFLSRFNPFASNNTPTSPAETPPIDINGDGIITNEEMAVVKLKKVSSMPIAGFTIFAKERLKEEILVTPTETTTPPQTPIKKVATKPVPPKTEFALALRYVERATGNIYQTFADKIEERRFSGTIIPKVYDAYFGNSASSVVMRHLKGDDRTIETFMGTLPKEKLGEDLDTNEIKGSFLVDNIKDISVSPDASKIFYLFNAGESALGTTLNLSDSKKTQIFDSAFTEWNSFWPSSKIVTLTTKPSGGVPGYMYTVDVDKKNLTKVLGGVNGLTTLMSPDGKLILYSNNNLSLYLYHTDTKTFELLGVKTLPEKCTWDKTSEFIYCAVPSFIENTTYPDSWYRGEVSFSDQIWRISIKDRNATMIADPFLFAGGEDIDGIKLSVDSTENYLFFVNKKDSYLWELELK